MVNNRGWVRIVEATICALLILATILIHAQSNKVYFNIENYADVESVLDEMIKEKEIRNEITNSGSLGSSNPNINLELGIRIKRSGITINNTICDKKLIDSNTCKIFKTDEIKNIHVYERIIGTDINPKYNFTKDTRILKVIIFEEKR